VLPLKSHGNVGLRYRNVLELEADGRAWPRLALFCIVVRLMNWMR